MPTPADLTTTEKTHKKAAEAAGSKSARQPAAPGRPAPGHRDSTHRLLAFQKSAGNRAVLGLLGAQPSTGAAPLHARRLSRLVQRQQAPLLAQRAGGTSTTTSAPRGQTTPPTTTGGPQASPEVKKAIEAFAKADPTKVEAAANAYAKKKAEAKDVDVGKGVKGSGSAEGALQAGAWGGAEIVELENAYALLVEAGVVVGGAISLEGELEREFGPIKAKLSGKFQAFAGAMAKVSGRLEVGAEGLSASGEASAFAGAKAKQGVSLEFTKDDVGAEIGFEAEETAGALATAKGALSFTKNEIAVGGEVEAFAGARVEGTATAKGKLYGRDAFKASGKLKAEVGAGGKAKGGFSFRRGVLHIEVDADAAAGIGFGAGADLYTDFKPIAVYIWRQMDKVAWSASPQEAERVLKNPRSAKPALVSKLKQYSDFKVNQLKADKADNYAKIEKVQAYVGEVLPRKQVKGRPNAAEIDTVIKEAIEETLLPAKGKTKVTAKVKDGKVEDLKDLADPKDLKGGVRSKKTGEALSSIIPYEDE